jgi:arginase
MRAAGLIDLLASRGISVEDRGDVSHFRWRSDKAHPRAMNPSVVAKIARETAAHVSSTLAENKNVLVLGGDCTVELGTVAGALQQNANIGLVYIDLDTDLTTPASTLDGALDWMGVAHMLNVDGALPELAALGPRTPMLRADQVHFFANDNVEPSERQIITSRGIAEVRLTSVAEDPAAAAHHVVNGWAAQFERLLVHLDVDVLDFVDMPLAENTRRNWGLPFDKLMAALNILLRAPNLCALTVTELNPDHGESDGSTVRQFAEALANALGGSAALEPR